MYCWPWTNNTILGILSAIYVLKVLVGKSKALINISETNSDIFMKGNICKGKQFWYCKPTALIVLMNLTECVSRWLLINKCRASSKAIVDIRYFARKSLIFSLTLCVMKKCFVMMVFELYMSSEICWVVLLSYLTGLILDTLDAVPAHYGHF